MLFTEIITLYCGTYKNTLWGLTIFNVNAGDTFSYHCVLKDKYDIVKMYYILKQHGVCNSGLLCDHTR